MTVRIATSSAQRAAAVARSPSARGPKSSFASAAAFGSVDCAGGIVAVSPDGEAAGADAAGVLLRVRTKENRPLVA